MAALELNFLNAFRVSVGGNPRAHFRSVNVQALLVYLVLETDRAHARDSLATLLWPDETETVARRNLRQSIYQLRRTLGEEKAGTAQFLRVDRQSVQFNPDADYRLDVQQFVDALEAGNFEAAAKIYSGELLPRFACESREFLDWLRRERERLNRLALESLYELAEQHLSEGEFSIVQTIARRQLDLEPWREAAHRQLMTALAHTGDRSAALAQFDHCTDVLADELGVPPAPETFALFEAVRDGHLQEPAAEAEPDTRLANNLPPSAIPFVGRSVELQELTDLLLDSDTCLVTVVGAGGMGKTRLAVEAASQLNAIPASGSVPKFPDGIFFLQLAPLSDPDDIPVAIASAIDYRFHEQGDPRTQIVEYLRRKSMLLILDNFEHLLDGGADFVADVSEAASGCQLCVTSREKLNLQGEVLFPISGLALAPPHPVPNAQSPSPERTGSGRTN